MCVCVPHLPRPLGCVVVLSNIRWQVCCGGRAALEIRNDKGHVLLLHILVPPQHRPQRVGALIRAVLEPHLRLRQRPGGGGGSETRAGSSVGLIIVSKRHDWNQCSKKCMSCIRLSLRGVVSEPRFCFDHDTGALINRLQDNLGSIFSPNVEEIPP